MHLGLSLMQFILTSGFCLSFNGEDMVLKKRIASNILQIVYSIWHSAFRVPRFPFRISRFTFRVPSFSFLILLLSFSLVFTASAFPLTLTLSHKGRGNSVLSSEEVALKNNQLRTESNSTANNNLSLRLDSAFPLTLTLSHKGRGNSVLSSEEVALKNNQSRTESNSTANNNLSLRLDSASPLTLTLSHKGRGNSVLSSEEVALKNNQSRTESVNSIVNDTLYLTLDSAIQLALQNNKQIQIAQEKLKVQLANKNIAFANFLPQIALTGTYTRLSKSQGFPMTIPVYGKYPFPVYNPQNGQLIGITESIPIITGAITETLEMVKKDNYAVQGRINQTLFSWGKLLNAYKIAGLSLDIEKENLRKTIADLKLKTAESFYQTLLATNGAQLINESYQQMERHIQQIERLYQSGLVGRLDLLRAKVQLTNIRSQLIRIENAKNLSYDALRMLLGIDEDVPLVLKDDFIFIPQELQLDSAIAIALAKRTDIKIMRDNIKILKKSYQIQKTANLPSLFSAFNYEYKKPFSFTESDWGKDYNVTFGLQMPLFTGGANLNKIKQAKSQLNQMRLGLNMLEDAVRLEVKSLYYNLQQEKNILSYQDENVKTAEQALILAEEKYENGLITNLEYIDTQLALTQAKFDRLNAIANCILAQIRLLNAIGKY